MADLRPPIALLGYVGQRYHGTAWLISERLALTAAHCVGDRTKKERDPRRLALLFRLPKEDTTAVAEVIVDKQGECFAYDVALLRLASPMTSAHRRPLRLCRFLAANERWTGYGFPAAHPSGLALSGEITSLFGNVEGVDALQLTLDQGGHGGLEGSSGGPVLIGDYAVGVIRYHPPAQRASTIHATSITDVARLYPEVAALLAPPADTDVIIRLTQRLNGLEGGLFEAVLGETEEFLRAVSIDPGAPALRTFVHKSHDSRRAVVDYLLRYCPTGLQPLKKGLESLSLESFS